MQCNWYVHTWATMLPAIAYAQKQIVKYQQQERKNGLEMKKLTSLTTVFGIGYRHNQE